MPIRLVDPDRGRLLSGLTVNDGFLVGRRPDAQPIPTAAIISEAKGTGVSVPGSDQKPRFRPIRWAPPRAAARRCCPACGRGENRQHVPPGAGSATTLTRDDANAIASSRSAVAAVAPVRNRRIVPIEDGRLLPSRRGRDALCCRLLTMGNRHRCQALPTGRSWQA